MFKKGKTITLFSGVMPRSYHSPHLDRSLPLIDWHRSPKELPIVSELTDSMGRTSDDDVIFVSSTKNCRHHDSSTSTVHDGSDADSDDFRISKALGKELMEALSDPKIQSLELDWSPQDLKSRLKSFNTSGLSTP